MNSQEVYHFHPLFEDVQLQQVFADGKTFVDCIPRSPLSHISALYNEERVLAGFNLSEFISKHFDLPVVYASVFSTDTAQLVEPHIEALWNVLTRQPDKENGSLLPLPYPYIVPGGRFGEIYYWDSYFTMLGLNVSGRREMLTNMVNNFSYLIDTVGYIPNGNRSYYIGRSQPPFYSLMIDLLAETQGRNILVKYLPQLEKEYRFWMNGTENLNLSIQRTGHVVQMLGGEILNRYWDSNDTPRPESYREDIELASHGTEQPAAIYRHLRAGAASGWDFSSRWFRQVDSFASIHCTDFIPVDLNCLLFHLEEILAEAKQLAGDRIAAAAYRSLAAIRKAAIQEYCWNEEEQFYFDYDTSIGGHSIHRTLAAGFPLFFGIADNEQAQKVANQVEENFLKAGGLITTLETTGQQWDAPNGWAPLQWMMISGLERYGHKKLAREIAERWIKLNRDVFRRTGKLMEKYNVVDTKLDAGGGEYPGQDGFGWTNGVLLTMIKDYGTAWK